MEIKRINQLPVADALAENTNVLIEADGSTQRIPAGKIVPKGMVKTVNNTSPDDNGNVNIATDSTLTQYGQAADAAAVGEKVEQLSEEIGNIGNPTDAQVSAAVAEYLDENPVQPTTVVQITGNSETAVMSQDATTRRINLTQRLATSGQADVTCFDTEAYWVYSNSTLETRVYGGYRSTKLPLSAKVEEIGVNITDLSTFASGIVFAGYIDEDGNLIVKNEHSVGSQVMPKPSNAAYAIFSYFGESYADSYYIKVSDRDPVIYEHLQNTSGCKTPASSDDIINDSDFVFGNGEIYTQEMHASAPYKHCAFRNTGMSFVYGKNDNNSTWVGVSIGGYFVGVPIKTSATQIYKLKDSFNTQYTNASLVKKVEVTDALDHDYTLTFNKSKNVFSALVDGIEYINIAFDGTDKIDGLAILNLGVNQNYPIRNAIVYNVVFGLDEEWSDESAYSGMSGVAFGTSLTYRSQTTGGYLQFLPALSGIDFDNQGVGSSGIFYPSGEYNMLDKIKAYTGYADKDVVIVEGFVNDWYNDKALGEYTDTTETSVCGCVYSALTYILTQNPSANVFLILDHYGRVDGETDMSSTVKNAQDETQYTYYEEIAKVAEGIGVKVIKLYEMSGINSYTPQYFMDYIHLNNGVGAKQAANAIWSEIKRYCPNV